jgi:hypothetical protein
MLAVVIFITYPRFKFHYVPHMKLRDFKLIKVEFKI